MRKNIFEQLESSYDRSKEIERMCNIFIKENTLVEFGTRYTIAKYVDECCFSSWKNRGHCVDLRDFLAILNFKGLQTTAETSLEDYLQLIEIIFNCWKMVDLDLNDDELDIEYYEDGNFYFLHNILLDELSRYNYKAVYDAEKEQLLVIEDKPEVTATAEVADEEITMEILRYNHFSMKGDLKSKKTILLAMGANLEPKRSEIEAVNSKLASDVFFMLNNMNLRHNNGTPGDKSYKQAVAEMPAEDMENWYDELYQMMLLAILELDQRDRFNRVAQLKATVCGGT